MSAEIDIAFAVMMTPKAAPRPRTSTKNGVIRSYTPASAQSWKRTFASAALEFMPTRPISGPVRMDVCFVMPRPQRLMRKKDPDGELWCTTKPDRDNLDKSILDAMKAWWGDDAQVCTGLVSKVYHAKDGRPEVRVRVRAGAALAEPEPWALLHSRAMR